MEPTAAGHDRELVARALASAGAVLVAYVGVVHEVIGTTLYPDGPAFFGGSVGWHAAGLGAIAAGGLLLLASLGVARVPWRVLAAVVGASGALVALADALTERSFHLFAATLPIAALAVAFGLRRVERSVS
jgi:hypothetical protein